MAFYADTTKVRKSNQPAQYDAKRKPGEKPASPGIYKCQSCGYEDVFNRECEKIPPCANCGPNTTTWKLLVKAVDN